MTRNQPPALCLIRPYVQIIEAVRTVAAGRKYLTPEIAHLLLDSVTGRIGDAPHDQLSEREMQTLLMEHGAVLSAE